MSPECHETVPLTPECTSLRRQVIGRFSVETMAEALVDLRTICERRICPQEYSLELVVFDDIWERAVKLNHAANHNYPTRRANDPTLKKIIERPHLRRGTIRIRYGPPRVGDSKA